MDFSGCAKNALEYAIDFAKSTEARITLLHAYQIPIPAAEAGLTIDANIAEDFILEGQNKMKQIYSDYPDLAELAEPFEIKMSFASDAIVNTAKEVEADMIIMGTHGANNAIDELMGSNTLHVIKKCHLPVLAVPANTEKFKISEILFSYDYKSINNKELIQPLIDFALAFGAKLHIIHITDKLDRVHQGAIGEAKILEQFLKGIPHHYHMTEGEHIEDSILEYIKTHQIDTLAVMPRRHNLFEKLFQSSVTKQLVHHSNVPIFAFPE